MNEYQRIVGLQLKQVKSTEEVLKQCPRCDYGEFIHPQAERFNCMVCNIKICPNCNSEPPHPGINCRRNRELLALKEEESKKEPELAIEGVKKCP